MRIGIVLAKPPSYSETFFNTKIEGLLENRHDVTLYVQDFSGGFESCKVVSAPKVSKNKFLQVTKMGFVFFGLLFKFKQLRKFIALEKVIGRSTKEILRNVFINSHVLKANLDWIHFGFATLAINSENVAESIGAKMAVSCRGYDMDVYPLKHNDSYDLTWNKVDKVHAISEYMLNKAYENGLSKSIPTTIIYPAVDSNLFQNVNTNKTQNKTIIKITTIARLHWIKGLDYTLKALNILKSKGITFHYQIIGDGPEYESLCYAVDELGLNDYVEFLGKLPHQETINLLEETDIYLQYSHSEGFCNAAIEAQAMGCLCIVSDGGALPENILDKETGFTVPKRNPKMLAETIFSVLQLDDLVLFEIKKQAKKRVLNQFKIEDQQIAFINFYE